MTTPEKFKTQKTGHQTTTPPKCSKNDEVVFLAKKPLPVGVLGFLGFFVKNTPKTPTGKGQKGLCQSGVNPQTGCTSFEQKMPPQSGFHQKGPLALFGNGYPSLHPQKQGFLGPKNRAVRPKTPKTPKTLQGSNAPCKSRGGDWVGLRLCQSVFFGGVFGLHRRPSTPTF